MTRDRSNIMMRLFTVVMLIMVSMGARADVKILYGEKGTEKFEGTGGKIEVTQKESDDKTQVTVYLTVTPDNGYTMAKVGKILHGIWDKSQNKLVVDTNNEKSSEGGGVFGGGDASAVLGSTIVTLKGNAEIEGNVFGGGNEAEVSGSATVNIKD